MRGTERGPHEPAPDNGDKMSVDDKLLDKMEKDIEAELVKKGLTTKEQ